MSVVDEKIESYPVTFNIDYPGKQSRIKAFFRILLIIPAYLWLHTLSLHLDLAKVIDYYRVKYHLANAKEMATPAMQALKTQIAAESATHASHLHSIMHGLSQSSGFIFLSVFLMVVFRKKYPQWLFAFNLGFLALHQRFTAFLYCLTSNYPSSDQDQSVHLRVAYPEIGTLHRMLPFVKWLLLAPHYICLLVLMISSFILALLGWVVVVFTGNYPHWIFNYIEGCMRWSIRVFCYGFLLMTDVYPPFSLK